MLYSEIDKGDLLLELLVDGCGNDDVEYFNSVDVSDVAFSKGYYRKRRRIISGIYWKSTLATLKSFAIRVAAALFVVLSLGTATVLAVPSLRKSVKKMIIEATKEWKEESVRITFDDGNKNNKSEQPLEKIEKVNKPASLPEGVTEEMFEDTPTSYICDYYSGDEWVTDFKQLLKREGLIVNVNTENCTVYEATINGKGITVSVNPKTADKIIFWEDKDYFYIMSGIDLDIMLDLISRIP